MKTVVLVVVTLVTQVALGWPGAPGWLATVFLPMVFIVAPPLLIEERRWPHRALLLGLAWDLTLEPVIGPGTIAWSASAVIISMVVPLVADRSPRAWWAFGAVGTILVIVIRHLALMPLGLASPLTLRYFITSLVLTASWCALVGWIIALDLPARWRRHRARTLR
jgi:hypothetical protein